MEYKKKIFTLCLFFVFFSSFLYSNDIFGKYTYNIDTVLSMMKLSLIEKGLNPDSNEFDESYENMKVMIDAFGVDSFIEEMKEKSPFSYIELTSDFLILHLKNDDFKIPIEVVKNEIYSKGDNSFNEILGFLESDKLYYNFYIANEKSNNIKIDNNLISFFLIPFEKEV